MIYKDSDLPERFGFVQVVEPFVSDKVDNAPVSDNLHSFLFSWKVHVAVPMNQCWGLFEGKQITRIITECCIH